MSQHLSNTPSVRSLQRLRQFAELDFHVLLTLLFRGWGILAGAITLVLLPLWLSPTQQGYYYTFASLLALQIFFELGLSQVIIHMVSHEAAHLHFRDDGTVSGDSDRLARLYGVVALIRRWYTAAAVGFAILANVIGWIFFSLKGQGLSARDWAPAWTAVVLLTAINLYLSPRLAMIEGVGLVGQVAKLRLIQSVAGYVLLWTLLLLGGGLWVTVSVPAVSVIATTVWLRFYGKWLRLERSTGNTLNWRQDIFPLQWRIAVSWACGYFIFNLFTPIVFATHGAKEAGQLGMAISVFNAITTLGLSWINAKAPAFSMHISRGEYAALDRLFTAVTKRSTMVTALLAFVVVAVVASQQDVAAMHRISSPWTLFWLACATVTNTFVNAAATYMRAHREEPMLPITAVAAAVTIVAVLLTRDSVALMMMTYAAIGLCVGLPWTLVLLKRYQGRHLTTPNFSVPKIS